jgi:hypothetical protein
MDANEVDELREALRRADMALAGLRNALVVERELQARCAELERERDDLIATCAAGAAEIAKSRREEREYKAQIAALTAERDAARADLARYTAVYGDPDAPVDPPAPDLDMGTPLLPGLADLILAAPQIRVGDHVRCESLGGLTGIVETVNPSDRSGWDQCLVRDDREGHVWGAAAFILEVIR